MQFFKNISYYAGITFNAFSDLLCSKLCWHNQLVPNCFVSEFSHVIACGSQVGHIWITLWASGSSRSTGIGGGNRGARGPWPLLNSKPLHRNVIFAIENHFSLVKWPPLLSVASSASVTTGMTHLQSWPSPLMIVIHVYTKMKLNSAS